MYNPLLQDLSTLKNEDLDKRVNELMEKYFIASKFGQGGIMHQIVVILDAHKAEQFRRQAAANKKLVQNQNQDLGDYIKINS